MILKFDLPEPAASCIQLEQGERIYYTVPFDVAENSRWLPDSYLAVSTKHLWVIQKGELKEKIGLSGSVCLICPWDQYSDLRQGGRGYQ